ncbi:MAG TPA: hypothetical protein VLI05_04665 [Candidatus Saccharimonadia bacterium]|nr:hypothetical protein [Candidatus Saccharimonadia bacterium]
MEKKRLPLTAKTTARLLACLTPQQLTEAFPEHHIVRLLELRARAYAKAGGVGPDPNFHDGSEAMTEAEASDQTAAGTVPDAATINRVAKLLIDAGIDADQIGKVEKVRVGTYQMLTKNNAGEAEIHDLDVTSVVMSPAGAAEGPAWPVVQPAAPVVIRHVHVPKPRTGPLKVAVVLPDPQIGYWQDPTTGELVAMHDEQAMNVALQIMRFVNPHKVVNLGDFLDLPNLSRFVQLPTFATTMQAGLDRGHLFLAEQEAAAPNAEERVLLEGNHDYRLLRWILDNARAAFGLRQANQPASWPVMSIQHLLRLAELGVQYVDGYPAARYWINDRLNCQHGKIVRSNGSTAKAVVDDEGASSIFGHVHRIEMQWKTDHSSGRNLMAFTPGCLCRVDGAVPSANGAASNAGRPVSRFENWQQGLAVVTYLDGDQPFAIEPIHIHDGRAVYRGRVFQAEVSLTGEPIAAVSQLRRAA